MKLNKPHLIERIRQINVSATEQFLGSFGVEELLAYLDHLESIYPDGFLVSTQNLTEFWPRVALSVES